MSSVPTPDKTTLISILHGGFPDESPPYRERITVSYWPDNEETLERLRFLRDRGVKIGRVQRVTVVAVEDVEF